MENTSSGLPENVAGMLCYLLGWVTGILFLLIERDNRFVRFHAWQALVTFGGLTLASVVAPLIPGIGLLLASLLSIAGLALWIVLLVKAFQGERFKLPVVGDYAEQQR